MSQVSLGDLVDDVMMALGQNFDDAESARSRILFNAKLALDRYRKNQLARMGRGGESAKDSGAYHATYVVDIAPDPQLHGRLFFELPAAIYDLHRDRGIDYITYFDADAPDGCDETIGKVRFSRTSPSELLSLFDSEIERPSPSNPYFYRTNQAIGPGGMNRVYLLGPDGTITKLEVGLYTSIAPIDDIDEDEGVMNPEDAFNVRRILLDMGRTMFMVPNERLRNDGRASEIGQPPIQLPPSTSINDISTMPE